MPQGISLLIASALVLSLLLTPVVRRAALCWGLVDMPDGGRKVHRKPIPRIGGVAVFIAYFGSGLALSVFAGGNQFGDFLRTVKWFAPAALLVFLAGLADDVIGLKPWHKLAAEIVAGLLLVFSGASIPVATAFPGHAVVAGILTIIWLVLCANAINLIDGLDGLAAGMGLLATVAILLASVLLGSSRLMMVTAPLLGALLGFLVFNFNPASIFLGDSGSLLIGFLVACYGILWSGQATTVPAMAVPAIALAVPLADTSLAITRRFLRGQPIFSADRSHVHHRLLARGFTHRRAVLILYGAAAVAGIFSLGLAIAEKRWAPFILVVLVGAISFGIRKLRYLELETAAQLLTPSAVQHEIAARLAVRNFEDRLAAAVTPEECWAEILQESPPFGFEPTRMQFLGQAFIAGQEPRRPHYWVLHLPISEDDWIELAHEPGTSSHSNAAIPYIEVIRTLLARKLTASPVSPHSMALAS